MIARLSARIATCAAVLTATLALLAPSTAHSQTQPNPDTAPPTTVIVGAGQGVSLNPATVTLDRQDMLELGLVDSADLAEYLATASASPLPQATLVFVDGRLAGGIEVLRSIPIQAILAARLLEGAEATAYGAPAGVAVLLVYLDSAITVRRAEVRVAPSVAGWQGEASTRATRRTPAGSWSLEARAATPAPSALTLNTADRRETGRQSLEGSIEVPTALLGDLVFGGRLDHVEGGAVNRLSDGAISEGRVGTALTSADLTGTVTFSWRNRIPLIGWVAMGEWSGTLPLSDTHQGSRGDVWNQTSSLLAAGPVAPWGRDWIYLTLAADRTPTPAELTGSTGAATTVDLVNLSIPLSSLFDPGTDRLKNRITLGLSQQALIADFGSQTVSSIQIVFAHERRLRVGLGMSQGRQSVRSLRDEDCLQVGDDDPLSPPSRQPALDCPLAIGLTRTRGLHAEFSLSAGPRGPWSVSTRWDRSSSSPAQTALATGPAASDRDRIAVRVRWWASIADDGPTVPGRPRDRYELTATLIWQESGVEGAADRTALSLQGRYTLQTNSLGFTVRVARAGGTEAMPTDTVQASLFVDFPLARRNDSPSTQDDWRDGPRIRLEIGGRQRGGEVLDSRISLRLATGF